MLDKKALLALSPRALLTLAHEQGVPIATQIPKTRGRMKAKQESAVKESIVREFMAGMALEPKAKVQAVAKPVVARECLTAQAVHELLATHLERGLGLTVDDSTWTISYRDKQDSGHLSVPPALLVRLADMVMM